MSRKNLAPDYWNDALDYLSRKDEVMGEIIARYKGETLSSRGTAYYTLVRSIVGQQISVKAAASVWNRLEQAAGKVLPDQIMRMNDAELRACGLSAQKVKYMRGLSEFFAGEGKGLLWPDLHDDEVTEKLLALKGIGVWTVQMFKIFHLLRPDEFPIKDIGLQKAIHKHYGQSRKKPLTLPQMEKHAVKLWKPYRTVATWYLWRSLDPEPVEY